MSLLGERKKQREKLFFYFYSVDDREKLNINSDDFDDLILYESQEKYASKILNSAEKEIEKVDEFIKNNLRNFRFERIGDIQRAVLRLALLEIFFVKDIDAGVSISEAVHLTKKYSDENKARFVNGILGKIVRDRAE